MAQDPRPFVGLVAGIAAGLVASAAMAAFQAGTAKLFGQDEGGGDSSTVKGRGQGERDDRRRPCARAVSRGIGGRWSIMSRARCSAASMG